ncbi:MULTISPECIES: DUF2778 domain-containing protein [Burkholderia]|nr:MULTISPECIES: DUF2778 domain-containing protein [Burkholderia]EAY67435.1 hypothetical protein BDAG_00111 [Burkholderia dolosa AU0158]MCC5030683.1 DUF2778 domain-containing protein [Burkholderia dolosa]UEB52779.1 DUF2778 domain-containing protein [Burkholderia dolosa]UEC16058.1 DUF2778 domain-containing protein [Burkholderia dolosa]
MIFTGAAEMHICTFELNDKPISRFEIAGRVFPAFSGAGPHANKRTFMCVPDLGPLPVGTYYIVDRKSGGWLGALRDSIAGNSEWFALYADDGRVDDETFCDGVKRGRFRLHAGSISKGCITIATQADFNVIKGMLRGKSEHFIPGRKTRYYGKVIVK